MATLGAGTCADPYVIVQEFTDLKAPTGDSLLIVTADGRIWRPCSSITPMTEVEYGWSDGYRIRPF